MKAMKITAIILSLLICLSAAVACDIKGDDKGRKSKDKQSQEDIYDNIIDELNKASKQDAVTVRYRFLHEGVEDREYSDILCIESSNGWKAHVPAGSDWMFDTWYEKDGEVYKEYGTDVLNWETMETVNYCRVREEELDFEMNLLMRCLDIGETLSHFLECNECDVAKSSDKGTEIIKVTVSETKSCEWCEENNIENMYLEYTISNGLISTMKLGSAEAWGEYIFEYKCAPIKLPAPETESGTESGTESDIHNPGNVAIGDPGEYSYIECDQIVYVNNPDSAITLRASNYEAKGSVAHGTELRRIGLSNDAANYWSKVVYNEETYYVATKFLTSLKNPDEGFVAVEKIVVVNDQTGYLNIRNLPSFEGSAVIGWAIAGEETKVVAENTETGWYKIEFVPYGSTEVAYGYIKSSADNFVK